MNKTFSLKGCPRCLDTDFESLVANIHRPLGEKIQIIDIFKDPRTSVLASMFGTTDPYGWKVPVAFLDKPVVKKFFNSYEEGRGHHIMLAGTFFPEHHRGILRQFLEG